MKTGWWDRNAAEIQAISTVVLVVVTAVYVVLTKRIGDSSSRQADASLREVDALAEQTATVRQQLAVALQGQRHAERVFEESVRARLNDSAPRVTILATVAGYRRADTPRESTVPTTLIHVYVVLKPTNHGPGPAKCTPREPEVGRWNSDHETVIADGAEGAQMVWSVELERHQLDAAADEHFTLEVETAAVDGGVLDVHRWTGPLPQVDEAQLDDRLGDRYVEMRLLTLLRQSRSFVALEEPVIPPS